MSKSLNRVRAALEAAGVEVTILAAEEETRTAAQAAAVAGCEIDQIVKSILFRGEASGRLWLFLTAGGNQVDSGKAAALTGETLSRADPAQVRAETGFAIGGVAPVGHLTPPRAFLDRRLTGFATVWAAAGTPRHIFSLSPAELERISDAPPADFTA